MSRTPQTSRPTIEPATPSAPPSAGTSFNLRSLVREVAANSTLRNYDDLTAEVAKRTCSWCFLAAPWADPTDDPSYCCEAHEQIAERLRYLGGASAVGENVAKAFEARILALDAQCPKAVAS